jgi:hypothetical protein
MKPKTIAACLILSGTFTLSAATISNPWSGAAGDRANFSAFAFKADAGLFPTSVDPAGSLTPTFQLDSLTLIRPALASPDAPSFGTGPGQLTASNTPVFIDIYTDFAANAFSGYLGSSSSSVTWDDTVSDQPYTFNFRASTSTAAPNTGSFSPRTISMATSPVPRQSQYFRQQTPPQVRPGLPCERYPASPPPRRHPFLPRLGGGLHGRFHAHPQPTTLALGLLGATLLIFRRR